MADYQWTGGAKTGVFAAAGNWQNITTGQNPATSAPGAADDATIGAAPGLIITGAGAAAALTLDSPATIAGELVVGGSGGLGVLVNSQVSMAIPLMLPNGNNAGPLSLTTLLLTVGYAPNSTGVFAINRSNRVVIAGPHPVNNYGVIIAHRAGSTGTLSVSGIGAVLDGGGEPICVGNNGTGVLAIGSLGSVTAGNGDPNIRFAVAIGNRVGANGTVTVTDAKLTASGAILVGRSGTGKLEINAAGLVKADNMSIGNNLGGTGSVVISGAAAQLDLAGTLQVGNPGEGSLTVTDQNMVSVAGAMTVYGSVTLSGSSIKAASITIEAAGTMSGSGEIIAAGGITIAAEGAVEADNDLFVDGPVTNNGAFGAAAKSYLTLEGPLMGKGTVPLAALATVSLAGVDDAQVIVFSGSGATLLLRAPGAFGGSVQGFGLGDMIEIAAVADYVGLTDGVMQVTGLGFIMNVKLIGAYLLKNLQLTAAPGGNSIIRFQP